MSICLNFLLILVAILFYVGFKVNRILFEIPPLPKLENTYWGPGNAIADDTQIVPFKINIPDSVITDLQGRLKNARPFVPPLEGIQQQYGMNTNLLKEIVEHWRTKYNWREREQYLNKYPHFKTKIQGLKVHFMHIKPKVNAKVEVIPMLMLHGWPGSIREFYEIIPLLTTPQPNRNFVFELIVPSLPGYGFSDGAAKPGLGAAQMAVVFKNLMERLGFEKYYLQGGDWGSFIVQNMATLYPRNVLGVHSNMCVIRTPLSTLTELVGSVWPSLIVEENHAHKMYPLSKTMSFNILESGYLHIQATKPDTVGVGLNDSPVGLAAYIIEKFVTATNPSWKEREDGGLKLKYSYTDILDNIMIYWVTGTITTAVRLYAESFSPAHMDLGVQRIPIEVPSACAKLPHEIGYHPDCILKEKFKNLVHSSDFERGGHFAAFEEPQLLADDIWSAVDKFRTVKHTNEIK